MVATVATTIGSELKTYPTTSRQAKLTTATAIMKMRLEAIQR
jgi:hypothetical protein